MGVKTWKRRIFSGAVCEQLVYNVPDRAGDPQNHNPERIKKERFEDMEAYSKFKMDISRRNHARKVNAAFDPGDIYSTLTFDNEWEVHTFAEAKRIRRNFVKALQRACPEAVIFLYMGRGKGTDRIHFHMISKGIPEEVISAKWKYGSVKRFCKLREHNWYDGRDHGADFTGLANYLFDHWTEEVGGHHWFQTKNARKPEPEKAKEVRVTGGYSEKRAPVAPKGYMLVETKATKYGLLYYKYVAIPEKQKRRSPQKKSGHRTG